MAKRKTPKVDNVIDLKPEKITDEQLKKVQDAVSNINQVQFEIGRLETAKHEHMHSMFRFRDQLTALQSEFQKEYGTFDVNIEDGKINYTETASNESNEK